MSALEPIRPWDRQSGESNHEYAWFTKYCELGESRSEQLVAKRCGVPVSMVRTTATKHSWALRAAPYDAAVSELAAILEMDEGEALHAQYTAGMLMLRMGLTALKYKNPALLKMKDIRELMQFGSEMARRGAGVADMKIDHTTTRRVDEMWADLLGEEVE